MVFVDSRELYPTSPLPNSLPFMPKGQGVGVGVIKEELGTKTGISKLYVGNLSNEVTDETLRDFFNDKGVPSNYITKMVVKKGFAFVEFMNQTAADIAVDVCNGKPFMNTVVRVEPAIQNEMQMRYDKGKITQVLVSNCNEDMTWEQLKTLFNETKIIVLSIEEVRVRSTIPGSRTFVVRVPNIRYAQRVLDEWNTKIVTGSRLQISIMEERFGDGAGDVPNQLPSSFMSQMQNENNECIDTESLDIPLRILVPNDFIGAIIGRGGATIRAISKGTGARLDIFRHLNRNYDMPEKPVSISGPKEKVTQACKKILEIVAQEADHMRERRGDIALKIFAPNSVVGRIIGKNGAVIKQIMDDTQTKIHISNQPEFMENNDYNSQRSNQRIITVRGSIDGMSQAESIISEKLREAYAEGKVRDRDLDFGSVFGRSGGVAPAPVMSNNNNNNRDPYFSSTNSPPMYAYAGRFNYQMGLGTSPTRPSFPMTIDRESEGVILSRPETAFMYIPDESVGALIGRKGSSIREIIHASGASIKILEGVIYINDFPSRRVVIHGGVQSLFLAEFLIYQRVVEDGHGMPENSQELTVEMTVPTEVVGRLIGKNGANVRDIQRQNYCRIKFLTEPDLSIPPPSDGETYVRITGTSDAFLFAQKKIRALLVKAMNKAFTHSNNEGNGSRNEGAEEMPTHNDFPLLHQE